MRVRTLLRVSSDQQLEKNGDLSIQRTQLDEYIKKYPDWKHEYEYFEGSKSGFKNSVEDREILQEIMNDAQNRRFDILVAYKDDRLGRRMWEIGGYLNALKQNGVDVFTVADGKITPELDDTVGQMMLAFRYNVAEKSSRDTGTRVKDTAVELVKRGKFLGGKAPYGYELVYSGELSKHGRALKKLVIDSEKAEVVKHIYDMAVYQGKGSNLIAKELNASAKYSRMAPNDVWKNTTIVSILKNPVYTGHVAYKRREKTNGKIRRLDQKEWIKSEECNTDIKIIETETWNKAQEMRNIRAENMKKTKENEEAVLIRNGKSELPLLDVIHCGYCGRKLTAGTQYYYWTLKSTGERRGAKYRKYRCNTAWQGEPHEKKYLYDAEKLESIVFDAISQYVENMKNNDDVYDEILELQNMESKKLEKEADKICKEMEQVQGKISILQENIVEVLTGKGQFSASDLNAAIDRQKSNLEELQKKYDTVKKKAQELQMDSDDWETIRKSIPSWIQLLKESDLSAKRVLVNKLISRIDVTEDSLTIDFKISLNDFLNMHKEERDGINDMESGRELPLDEAFNK